MKQDLELTKTSHDEQARKRLEYLREEIQKERISTSEIIELQSLIPYIKVGDTLLLEWAGVEENPSIMNNTTKYIVLLDRDDRLTPLAVISYTTEAIEDIQKAILQHIEKNGGNWNVSSIKNHLRHLFQDKVTLEESVKEIII